MKYSIKGPRTCYEWFFSKQEKQDMGESIKILGVDLYYLPRANFKWKKTDWWVTTGTLKTDPSEICHLNNFCKMTIEKRL